MTLVATFFETVAKHVAEIETDAADTIGSAADAIVAAYDAGRRTFVFGSGHSACLTLETCLRAGGLPFYNPIYISGTLATDKPYIRAGFMERIPGVAAAALDTEPIAPGDVLIVISNSGRNAVPIEMAIEGRKRGLTVIALTNVSFSSSAASRHPSGKRLFECADVVIDNGVPHGDGSVDVPGSPAKLAPLSTILGSVLLHAVSCAIADRLLARGQTPPVFPSGNVDGGDDYALRIFAEYADQITYL